ncbi:MAG: hypothetical protein K0S71_1586 [Clostridia bacterium]|nr:hypothetical protein [Clostridia bacterium]
MKSLFEKLLKKDSSSLLIILVGFASHVITYAILFGLAIINHLNERVMKVLIVLLLICFTIPLVSIGGIIIAIIQIRRRNVSKLPIIGLILNSIWLTLFLLISYFAVTVGMYD